MIAASQSPKITHRLKVALVGDTGVGKTSVSTRFACGDFDPYQTSTIGAAYLTKLLERPDYNVRFEIWDTAGQERYKALVPLYYRTAQVILVVLDLTAAASVHEAKSWLQRAAKEPGNRKILLVGNKADDARRRRVTRDQLEALGADHDSAVFEVSAKTGDGISALFDAAADAAPTLASNRAAMGTTTLPFEEKTDDWTSCCG